MRFNVRSVALTVTTLSAIACADAPVQTQTIDVEKLQSDLNELRLASRVIGGVLRIDRPSVPPIEICLGEADVDNARPMSVDCKFRIASISKVFVGTCVLILAGEGKLDPEDPVAKYLDGVPNGDRITLRLLANHRSGLFNHIQSSEVKQAFASDPLRLWTEDELLAFSFKNPPYFEPGEKHHYSNANTVLLAKVIEKVTGNPWQDEVRRRVIGPLELTNTSIPLDNTIPPPHSEGYAFGSGDGPFFNRGDVRYRVTETSPTWWGPAGSMISTIADLHKAARPLATGQLLTPRMQEELQRWTQADQPGYEYGFHIERIENFIGHEGDVPGFQTVMFYSPKYDASIVGFVNVYGWSLRDMPAVRMMRLAARTCIDHALFPEE